MRKEQKNLEQIISEIKSRNAFDYSQNEGSLISEQSPWSSPYTQNISSLSSDKTMEEFYDEVQTGLDVAGLIPVAGDVIDVINGLWYLKRGKTFDAVLSFIGVIPIIGSTFSLAVKGSFKGVKPLVKVSKKQAYDIINLIISGKGFEAADKFKKFVGGVAPEYAEDFVASAIPFVGGFLVKTFRGLQNAGVIGDVLKKNKNVARGVDEFFEGVSDATGWASPSMGKSGPKTTSGAFKGAWAINKIPRGALTKGGRLTTKGLNKRGAKQLWLLAQDKFAYQLFSNGGFSKLSKEIQEKATKAAKESLQARGVHPDKIDKKVLNREITNMVMLNYPKIFNETISKAKVTAKDYAKLGGKEYNREVGTWLSDKLSKRFLLKLGVKLRDIGSVTGMLIDMVTTSEEEAIDKAIRDGFEVIDKAERKSRKDEKDNSNSSGRIDPMDY